MKKIMKITTLLAAVSLLATGCIEETLPQGATVTGGQVSAAPNAFNNAVNTVTSTLVGQFIYDGAAGTNHFPWDYGYPSFFLQRDVMGQDITIETTGWYLTWYGVGTTLGPLYRDCQVPWTYYYRWINNCNIVLGLAGEEPDRERIAGAGIAHAMRAMFYMDLARMFYDQGNAERGTVPIVTEKTTVAELSDNPRASWDDMWAFILSDLDKAEEYLADYNRTDILTPDRSVVYGLQARANLTVGRWAEAERYAKLAQTGYTPLSEAQYLNRMTAFNTPTDAWMFGVQYKDSDPNITQNDSDSNWGSQMVLEVEGGLYGSAYGSPNRIDRHLYETIPATDFRKMSFIDFALDEMDDEEEFDEMLAKYTDYPDLIAQAANASGSKAYGGLSLKFRAGGGADGRTNPYKATVVAVPLMRVEEMMLIEAEAAGRQAEARGIQLLTAFAQLRDPSYTYNADISFVDQVWWQRRVELWGEGFATFDIKRLDKGVIRSYAGTNHPEGYRWNTTSLPQWMNLCIVGTEADYNFGLGENNTTPVKPGTDSSEYVW